MPLHPNASDPKNVSDSAAVVALFFSQIILVQMHDTKIAPAPCAKFFKLDNALKCILQNLLWITTIYFSAQKFFKLFYFISHHSVYTSITPPSFFPRLDHHRKFRRSTTKVSLHMITLQIIPMVLLPLHFHSDWY